MIWWGWVVLMCVASGTFGFMVMAILAAGRDR